MAPESKSYSSTPSLPFNIDSTCFLLLLSSTVTYNLSSSTSIDSGSIEIGRHLCFINFSCISTNRCQMSRIIDMLALVPCFDARGFRSVIFRDLSSRLCSRVFFCGRVEAFKESRSIAPKTDNGLVVISAFVWKIFATLFSRFG